MPIRIPENWSKWQDSILNGIKSIPKTGIPGTIIAYGENAVPILTGENVHELILTASQCKKGKIVIFSHTGYINSFFAADDRFTTLKENIKKFATNGAYVGNDDIILYVTQETSIADLETVKYKLFIWDGEEQNDTFMTNMINIVKDKGVGLVMGKCPWGWRQLNNDRPLEEAWFNAVLLEAGVCYTSGYTDSGEDGGFKIENSKANGAHVGQILTNISDDLQSVSKDHIQLLQNAVPTLPDKVWRQLSPKFNRILSSTKHKLKFPSPQNPVSGELDKLLLNMQFKELTLSACEGACVPGCKDFPGDFSQFNDLVGGETCLRISARFKNERHSTGYYLPAGWRMVVTVQQGDISNWILHVGAHSDELHMNDDWKRWPVVCTTKTLNQACTQLVSPFGGLVYFENHNQGTLEIKLENVIEAPYYDVTDPALCSLWEKQRLAPGLWAELAGENVIFTLLSSSVRDLKDPANALRLWDKVIHAHHHLKGTSPLTQRRERVVCDVQPSCGYMHAGYPVVTHLDIAEVYSKEFVMNSEYLRGEGSWGLYHEIGHNMQEDAWTFDGTTEVTCNIFTLHAMDVVSHRNPWIHPWLQNQIPKTQSYLRNGANFEDWKDKPGVALFIYAQLVNVFGWGSFKAIFRRYDDESLEPESNQDKIDLWFSMFSEIVGYNLLPMALLWGIPVSDSVFSLLDASGLIPFLPNDEITLCEAAKERVIIVEGTFSELVRIVDEVEYPRASFEFKESDPIVRVRTVETLS